MKYFAYGPNLNLEQLEQLGVEILDLEKGQLVGWELVFNAQEPQQEGVRVANIKKNKKATVEGAIIYLDDASIRTLDQYESYPSDASKAYVLIKDEQGIYKECVTYVGNHTVSDKPLKPAKEHLDHVLKGAPFFSLSYLETLKKIETA